MVVSPIRVVVTCCSDSWISVWRFLQQLRNGTGSFPVWFPGGCSVTTTQFCGWVSLSSDVCLATVVFEVAWVYYIVEIIVVVLSKLYWSVKFPGGCCQTASGIGGRFGVLVASGLSHAAPERRRSVSSLKFRLQLEHSHLSCFGHSSVGFDFVLPVVCSGEAICSQRLLQSNISLWNGYF